MLELARSKPLPAVLSLIPDQTLLARRLVPDSLGEGIGSCAQSYPQDLELNESLDWFWGASGRPVEQCPGRLPSCLGERQDVRGSAEVDDEVGTVHVSDANAYCITYLPCAQLRIGSQRSPEDAFQGLKVQQERGVESHLLAAQGKAAFLFEPSPDVRALVLECSLVQRALLGEQLVGAFMLFIHTLVSELPFLRNLLGAARTLLFDLLV